MTGLLSNLALISKHTMSSSALSPRWSTIHHMHPPQHATAHAVRHLDLLLSHHFWCFWITPMLEDPVQIPNSPWKPSLAISVHAFSWILILIICTTELEFCMNVTVGCFPWISSFQLDWIITKLWQDRFHFICLKWSPWCWASWLRSLPLYLGNETFTTYLAT